MEVEREEMRVGLEEADGAIEIEEAKVVGMQVEVGRLKSEIERRTTERAEECENLR